MSISPVSSVRSDITDMLSKMREISNKSKVFTDHANNVAKPTNVSPASSFKETLSAAKDVFAHVNNLQAETEQVKNAFISGDKSVSMSQVVIAAQKSKLAFEGLVTVRNKILESYKEIMNLSV